MSDSNVRPEAVADVQAIRAVHVASFPTEAEAQLVEELRAVGRLVISLVAEEGGEVVGHVAFSPIHVADVESGLGLAPVAVAPDFRRRGIAERLVREGLEIAASLGHGLVVVLGDPHYYGRFGFRPASGWALRDEYGGGDAFQALELRAGGIPTGGGLVRYAPEFSAFGDEG